MNKIILGIFIGIIISGTAFAGIQLAQIPEMINGYHATDLLIYVSQLKAKDDKVNQVTNLTTQYESTHIKPVCNVRGITPELSDCLNRLNKYNQDEKQFISNNTK